ncbi:uncharacterized protein SPAPADRAFT_57935 [Spathaspora passalidarum NRRL Y-27907]|uniref:Importin subunit beta-1/Transportin-1-like TPR repeats domain-containing protein n=1 Tax=Spathaspora passalidarum (strain NRRL Y-27907 / 11-Y1) TaxID=619300 RepID=G3AF53_SPAPN|nr:uncharacterized protein SPAPADRAFT_57935 [Spathaspora passalidarum NRRL Y-27907]EGW34842.1 hypothetical protein SPAPADRAFT_57935 [Spathaspora passalidarum NRRL Y-27907]
MQVVCEATQADDSELRASAFGCLARIMALYYRHMSLYMEKALYGLTVSGMQSSDERVACMAVEFWSTVCEEELEIALQRQEFGLDLENVQQIPPEFTSYNFALVAVQDVLPTLLTLLTRQNEDPEDDDWSVAMAAGACLQLFAQNIGNYVVEPTLNFVAANITNQENWRAKEAAVMAFGSILDGPEHEQLKSLITQALPPILNLINDEALQVKETVAWCLGRIADVVVDAIDLDTQLSPLIQALTSGLRDHAKVSTNCCWTLINLLEQLCQEQLDTNIMSPYYQTIIPILLQISARSDNEFSSRASAYEALATFVTYSANDTMSIVQGIATEVLSRLESTIIMQSQVTSAEDKGNLEELQTNILSLLTNVIRRLGNDIALAADNLMDRFIKLLDAQESNSLIEEDIFIAISAVSGAIGKDFIKYMPIFLPYLTKGLQNTDSPTCNTTVGLVADLAHSLGLDILPYLDGLMSILGTNLNNSEVRRELRPAILSAFGDIATAIGPNFQPYLSFVMQICIQAGQFEPEDNSLDTIDYVFNVRESVLDCLVGIVGGMADLPNEIYPYIGSIFGVLQRVAQDISMSNSDSVARSATGLLGDIAAMYPPGEFKQAYEQVWVTEFIKRTRSNPIFDEKTKDAARWAREQQKRQVNA